MSSTLCSADSSTAEIWSSKIYSSDVISSFFVVLLSSFFCLSFNLPGTWDFCMLWLTVRLMLLGCIGFESARWRDRGNIRERWKQGWRPRQKGISVRISGKNQEEGPEHEKADWREQKKVTGKRERRKVAMRRCEREKRKLPWEEQRQKLAIRMKSIILEICWDQFIIGENWSIGLLI